MELRSLPNSAHGSPLRGGKIRGRREAVVVGKRREIGGRYLGADRQTDSYFYLGKG